MNGGDGLPALDLDQDSSSGSTELAPPFIVAQPQDRTVAEGARTTFWVTLESPDSTTAFQWRRDGSAIPGANSASFTLGPVGLADAGRYTCDVQNSLGAATSDAAALTVVSAAQAGRFVNFSVVTSLDTPDADTTVGFAAGGAGTSGTQSVLIRAAGPSLTRFGLPNLNPAPRIELFSGSTKIGENDHWSGQASVVEAAARVGAFPFLASDSADAAMLTDTVAAAGNTIRISGQGGATGVVLTEIYDATPSASVTITTPRLVKFSVLKMIPAGANVSVGFVIAGQTPKTVLVRVVGPALDQLGVTGAMSNPVLTLLEDVTPIAVNDDWGGTPALKNVFATVGAIALDAASKDAALMMSLPHGSYVVQASEAGNRGGIALVEIFELP